TEPLFVQAFHLFYHAAFHTLDEAVVNALFEYLIGEVEVVPLDVVLRYSLERRDAAERSCDLNRADEAHFVVLVDQRKTPSVERLQLFLKRFERFLCKRRAKLRIRLYGREECIADDRIDIKAGAAADDHTFLSL